MESAPSGDEAAVFAVLRCRLNGPTGSRGEADVSLDATHSEMVTYCARSELVRTLSHALTQTLYRPFSQSRQALRKPNDVFELAFEVVACFSVYSQCEDGSGTLKEPSTRSVGHA